MSYLPDLRYVPEELTEITSKTFLAKGVPLAIFLRETTLDHIPDIEDRKQLVRNYLPQAHIFNLIKNNTSAFSNYRLVVSEGLYKYDDEQQVVEGSPLWLQSKGRQVVYTVSRNGVEDTNEVIRVAEYLSWMSKFYDEISINGDNLDPDGKLHLEIAVTVPEIPVDYNVRFKRSIKSVYNNVEYPNDIIGFSDAPNPYKVPVPEQVQNVEGAMTVGDFHAKLVSELGGTGWQTYAKDGRTSRSGVIIENIKKIRANSICIISVGYNDITVNTQDTPDQIAENIRLIIQASQDQNHKTIYLLPPVVESVSEVRTSNVRAAIVEMINRNFSKVTIEDLNNYDRDVGSERLNDSAYIEIAKKHL